MEEAVFVRLDEYKDIIDILDITKQKLQQSKVLLAKIQELKQAEQAELDAWQNSLAAVEQHLAEIDSKLE